VNTPAGKKGQLAMKKLLALMIGIAMMAPSAALGSATCKSYNPQLCDVSSNTAQRTNADTSANTAASTLPFTGLDVGLLVVGGGVLLAGGLVVRRLSREPS
jgi:hypothetical protein